MNDGNGYTEKEREDFWKNRDELIGRVMEVKYFRDTKNKNGGSSVSFGKFVQLREVGKEVSYD